MFSNEAYLSTLTFGKKKKTTGKQTKKHTEDSNKARTNIRMVIL